MKRCALRLMAALALVGLAPHSFGRDVFVHGFEKYAPGSSIGGQAIGSTTWSVAGFVAGDETLVSQADSAADGNSLLIGDHNTANRPRVTVSLVSGGFAPAALQAGWITFWMREDPSDAGAADRFKHTFGSINLQYGGGTSLNFSVTGGSSINPSLAAAGYVAADWNEIRIRFDNVGKTASLYVNGILAGTVTGAAADYSVASLTFGGYATSTTGDRIYIDDVRASIPNTYVDGFENYTAGSPIWLQSLGSGTWTAQGVITSATPDEAHVTDAVSLSGDNSLAVADNNTNNPRIFANFVTTGILAAPAQAGSVGVWVKEDDTDGSNRDAYIFMVGGTTVSYNRADKLTFSLAGAADILPVPLDSGSFDYDAEVWNHLRVDFDNVAQTATLFINGGYGATLTAPIGGSTNFTAGSVRFSGGNTSWTGDKAWYDDLSADFAGPVPAFEWRSALYPSDWQPGYQDEKGRFLHDFSYAGYKRGEASVPNIAGPVYNATAYGADPTGVVDSTVAIQNAINAAGTAGGGVVYLPAGTYKVSPQGSNKFSLHLNKNNVVLRGAGTGQTFVQNSVTTMRDKAVIRVSGPTSSPIDWYSGSNSKNLNGDVLLPSTVIPMASTTGFNVGDLIVIRCDLTDALILEMDMVGEWTAGNNYPGRMPSFCRRIVAKTDTTLTIDVPTRYPLRAGNNSRVIKPSGTLVSEIGVEDISIGMVETTTPGLLEDDWEDANKGAYQSHNSYAIYVSGAENCWIKRVNSFKPAGNATFHLLSNGIKLDKSRLITVDSCDLRLSQYKGAGGNGYLYNLACQESLVEDCRAEAGRHNLSINMMYCSGNVALRLYLKNSSKDSDFHQFLSMANLLDGTTCDGEMLESRYRGEVNNPTPGWTTVESVYWNTKGLAYANHSTDGTPGLRVINSYQLKHRGYVIGTTGPAYAVRSTDFVEGVGKSDKLIPQSLYLDQRMKRLGY